MSDLKDFDKKRWTVYTDERGQNMLMAPCSNRVYDITKTVVIDVAGEPAECTVSFLVNLVGNKSEAIEGYGVKTPQEE
jgi:hypothetical protein